ncbi:hypothetical protein J5Y04_24295 [Kitasatospora sp. RG8]|uniref:hypothetical protein n=1 Tax=Kitasatospora sp. RG8 TaxID=2820815 RepID=UPI001ADEDFFC|nr:hypothetical protein [Kitasatospora sp. RG8]MBP0452639.1 hypothetical protein [Kitasatospora sp. RG8]
MPEHERQANFDGAAIAKALHADATAVSDPTFGKGQHFQVQSENTFLSLDTFPETGVSRITTKGARTELFGGTVPTVEEEGVVFLHKDADHEHATVALYPDGAITIGYQVDTGPAPVAGLPDEQTHQEPDTEVVTPAAKPPEKPQASANRMPGAFLVQTLICFQLSAEAARAAAGNSDCTPLRTKQVARQRMEPQYREWKEDVWESDRFRILYEKLAAEAAAAEKACGDIKKTHCAAFHILKALFDPDETHSQEEWTRCALILLTAASMAST